MFKCPYGTFTYRRMPFRLCNAPTTFQRCMTAIFHDMLEDFMKVFMDDFSVFGIEVDRAKINVISKLPYPTNVKGVRSFLGHAGFYRRSVGYNPKNSSEKFDDVLWVFRTAYKTPTGCTPFRLVNGKACHLPVEIEHKAYWALKQCNMDLTATAKNRFMELNELMELRDRAYENTHIYKERTKKCHDSRLRGDKDFKVGDKVFLFNSRFKMHQGKLKSKWYGPNVVKTVYPYGTVEITDKNGICFKVNRQRLKKYYDEHIDTEDKEDLKGKKSTMLVKYLQSGILAH
ncbi:reverse transcriptase domain-containing protein [Tanacetum coccineum]